MQGRFGYGSYARVMDVLAAALKGKTYIAGSRFSAARPGGRAREKGEKLASQQAWNAA